MTSLWLLTSLILVWRLSYAMISKSENLAGSDWLCLLKCNYICNISNALSHRLNLYVFHAFLPGSREDVWTRGASLVFKVIPTDPANVNAVTKPNMFDHYTCIYSMTVLKYLSKMPEKKKEHESISHSVLCIMTSFRENKKKWLLRLLQWWQKICSKSGKISWFKD